MAKSFADSPQVLPFAREELTRYYQAVTGVMPENSRFGPWMCEIDPALDGRLDEWAVRVRPDGVHVVGAHSRAVLYGVYGVCTRVLGICFVRPGHEVVPTVPESRLELSDCGEKAAFPVRAYTVDRPISPTEALDTLAKLGYNTVAFSAAYWQAHKEAMLPLMQQRGIEPAISGHDLPFFLPAEIWFPAHPEWFSLYEGERIPHQFCFSSAELCRELAGILADYCRREGVRELTLMFNDNAYQCRCDACRKEGFMPVYLRFIETIQRTLREQGLEVCVYHIAYNAALAWNMLEDIPEGAQNHCMIACWGRNYRHSLAEAPDAWSARFHSAFRRWSALCREQEKHLAVFEYYGDHWMMGTLLPPLPQVIRQDMQHMRQLGIHRVDVLHYSFQGCIDTILEVVGRPLSPQTHEVNTEGQMVWLNLYLAGRWLWNPDESLQEVLIPLAKSRFGPAAARVIPFWLGAETALAPLTRFAGEMFKLRVTDVWHRDDFSLKGTHKTLVHPWEPQAEDPLTRAACDACDLAYSQLAPLVAGLEAADTAALTPAQQEDWHQLVTCGGYLRDKLDALRLQYRAQLAIEQERYGEAAACLREACAREKRYNGLSLADCERWLETVESLLPDR